LCIGDQTITHFELTNEEFYLKEKHLLAFENSINYENTSKNFADDVDLIKLSGSGSVVIITDNKPICQLIDAANPLAIKLEYILGWHGELKSKIVKGKESLFKRREDSKWVTFKGEGDVFCLVVK